MELYVSKTSQQNMPVEFNIYYSRSKTLVGIVFWICMMGVFIALAVSMATDPEEPKTGGAVFMGLICCGSLLFIVRLARSFLSAAKPAVTISREGIRFCNGKFAAWTNIAENTWHSQSINFIPAAAGIKIVLHEASRSISPPRLLRFLPIGILRCAIFTRLRRSGNYLRRITASFFLACDLNAEMGRKTRNLDAITNGQWYLLKAISLPIMQGGLICYDRILCLNIYPQNTK